MNELRLFHVTGRRIGPTLAPPAGLALRPALFARFRDLSGLRHAFPLVLSPDGDAPVRPLSTIVDRLLDEAGTAGPAGLRFERTVLRLEREIRVLQAEGMAGTLVALWILAAERLVRRGGDIVALDLARARTLLGTDGVVLGHDGDTPSRVVAHLWGVAHHRKARAMRALIDPLVVRLSDLLRAEILRSAAGRTAAALGAAFGAPHRDLFDLDAMHGVLAPSTPSVGMSDPRRRRITSTLEILRSERFFDAEAAAFTFRRADAALAAFRRRVPKIAELVRAIAVAELEVAGALPDGEDLIGWDDDPVQPAADDARRFPDHLVVVGPRASASARAEVFEALTSGLPVKVLFQTDDAAGPDARVATTAMGLGDVFVVQAASAELPRAASTVLRAIEFGGPALISVFTGVLRDDLPSYLVAAAAAQARAFPTFSYDPSAGTDRAHRFALDEAPQPDRTWPVHELSYADAAMQRVRIQIPFTLADLALCDPRFADHLAVLTAEAPEADLVPLGERSEGTDGGTGVPFVFAVDAEDRLVRVLIDDRLEDAARRSADAWQRLRELGSPGRVSVPAAVVAEAAPPAAPVAASAPVAVAADGPGPDDPYIETARCSTCNECTLLNPRMFAYDANRQAYIADPSAGTYRDLVEAAESCQVGVVHPGRPRDPNEPDLDLLLLRAQPFL